MNIYTIALGHPNIYAKIYWPHYFFLLRPNFAKSGQNKTKISIGPILLLYYEKSLVSSNLNSKQLHCAHPIVETFGHQKPRKKICSVLWTVPDNILTYFFSCEIAAPPTVQWRESSLDAQYRKPRKRDRGDSMHHQITSSSHHPHPESPFKSKSGKNNDLFLFIS